MEKTFYTQGNIGMVKYTVSFHNGVDNHNDGSHFFGIRCFSNKKDLKKCVDNLLKEGYQEK